MVTDFEWYRNQIKIEPYPKREPGGQSCGIVNYGVTLYCPHTNFSVSLQAYRSQIKNWELCMQLYELYLSEVC